MIYTKATYTSPQGRNHYEKDYSFVHSQIEDVIREVVSDNENKKSKEYMIKLERSKMTDSLRYDVLNRDSFKCQICGYGASDGVKLHVDHVVPVSKYGKTELNNLRALCEQCNIGKSNKLEVAT